MVRTPRGVATPSARAKAYDLGVVAGLERHEHPRGQLALDDRFWPVVIGTWHGEIEHRHIDAYYAWYDRQLARAEAEATKVLVIVDALEVAPTSAEIRRRFIHETDVREAVRRRVVGVFVVVRGPFLLGMVASIVRLVRGGLRLSTFGDVRTALERAVVKLDGVGVARPAALDPAAYVRPRRCEPA